MLFLLKPPSTTWKTFLDNHREVLAAMDFLVVPTVTFRLLYVLLVIQHERRKVLHVNVTAHPTAAWVIQQLRETFPFEPALRLLLLDRDSIFSAEVCEALRRIGVQPVRPPPTVAVKVVALPRLGGLHHRYGWADAA